MRHTTLVWHRHDLRLSDNHLYRDLDRCLSVYVFDPAAFARLPSCAQPEWDVTRTGPHAAQLLLAAVASLRASLRERGGELLVRCGDPASVLPQLVHLHGVDEVVWHEEPGSEEVATSLRVRSVLRRARCRTRIETGCTLYHPDDLPQPEAWASLVHPRQKMRCRRPKQRPAEERPSQGGEAREWRRRLALQPRVMSEWRRAVRAVAAPRPVLPAPALLTLAEGEIEAGELPSLAALLAPALDGESARPLFGLPSEVIRDVVARAAAAAPGAAAVTSEAAAHAQLARFVHGYGAAAAERGLADAAGSGSSKLSAPLALGLLSPRHVAAAATAVAEGERSAEGGMGWLVSHMEMRDFFLYSSLAAGPALFRRDGWLPVQAKGAATVAWRAPAEAPDSAWQRWAMGRTGLPLPDAAMRELAQTGHCSNRARQNAASFLAKDLALDWRSGAEWLQWLLADHEVAANWGNWAYFAGVGADPKQRHFRTVSQAAKYDRSGAYVRRWLPELAAAGSAEAALRPFAHGIEGWPTPLVDPASQLTWQDAQRLDETGRLL